MKLTAKQILGSNVFLYQEITKKLNDYFYRLKDIVAIKLVLIDSKSCDLEFHILNENFDTCIRIPNLNRDTAEAACISIIRDLTIACNIVKGYEKDMLRNPELDDDAKEYIKNLSEKIIESINRYKIATFVVDDLKYDEPKNNFVIIGTYGAKIKDYKSAETLSLRYAVKNTFKGMQKSEIRKAEEMYKIAFKLFCTVNNHGGNLYH